MYPQFFQTTNEKIQLNILWYLRSNCFRSLFGRDLLTFRGVRNFGVRICMYVQANRCSFLSVKGWIFFLNSHLNVSTRVLSAMSTPVGCAQFIEKVIDEFQVQNLITTHDLQNNFHYKWFTYKIDLDTQCSKGHKNMNKSSNFFWRY